MGCRPSREKEPLIAETAGERIGEASSKQETSSKSIYKRFHTMIKGETPVALPKSGTKRAKSS